jgi:tetratricopeptide (TPR) repeat protein
MIAGGRRAYHPAKDVLMILHRRLCAAFAVTLMANACATTSPLVRQQCDNADVQLARILEPLEALRAKGCDAGVVQHGTSECERLRLELDRLTIVCPGHVPTLMANAVIAYDEHQPVKSQQVLDQILAQSRRYPDAAVLRARIAIEEGNLPFARRLLEQQIKLTPDHAGLYETYGATLYLAGQLLEARRELTAAGALGAPRWRIAYHLGLVEEASGRLELARQYYSEALEGNPGWAPAQSRLNALRARNDARR